jgi:hypothetical protein
MFSNISVRTSPSLALLMHTLQLFNDMEIVHIVIISCVYSFALA